MINPDSLGPDITTGPNGGRLAVTVDETRLRPGVGFAPRLVEEGQAGYWPVNVVTFAGDTLEEARAWCDDVNRALGLTPEEALVIRMTSHAAGGALQ